MIDVLLTLPDGKTPGHRRQMGTAQNPMLRAIEAAFASGCRIYPAPTNRNIPPEWERFIIGQEKPTQDSAPAEAPAPQQARKRGRPKKIKP